MEKYVFFIDNASIHKASCLKEFFSFIRPLYNAPYSPFLNPIEEVFGIWKHHFRLLNSQGDNDIIKNIQISAEKITAGKIQKFIRNSLEFLKDCFEKVDI
jgi:transposase